MTFCLIEEDRDSNLDVNKKFRITGQYKNIKVHFRTLLIQQSYKTVKYFDDS